MQGSQFLRTLLRATVLLAPLVLTACGSGDGFAGAGGGGPLEPTFTSIQANVFTPICEQCHSGAGAPFGLRLDAANSYALLVGVPSGEEPGFQRVEAGDPDSSYLIQKLEGRAGTGERMPAGLPPLPSATIATIRQWITDGALKDTPQSNAPIRVTSLSPLPSSAQSTLPASITAGFDRELNATTVDATTFRLDRSGGDGTFGNGNDVAVVPASVTVPAANTSSAVMSLTGVASVNDTYRITIAGTGPPAVLDLAGNALDGELAGVFPSGNGAAGGDFVAQFTVGGMQATLQSIQDNVFTPKCSGCHSGGGAQLPGSMNLTSVASSRAALVSVSSVEVSALQRVAPGHAADSYLIRKLEGTPGIVGERMPLFGTPLDQPTIDVIRQWIDTGAP
jgi:mono/diheme cytochrome c family protein